MTTNQSTSNPQTVPDCPFTEQDVFNYSLDLSEGKQNEEMKLHIASCVKCNGILNRFRKVENVVEQIKMEQNKPKVPLLHETVTGRLIPKSIGEYQILDAIAEGGMGKVWKAYDQSLDRVLAIKVMKDDLSHSTEFCERFIAEAKTVAKLNHPNIVHVYAVSKCDGKLFIVMEYVDGQSLLEKIRNRLIDIESAVRLFGEILNGVKAAHVLHIIHRDIKPANIMVSSAGAVKILDFGLAKDLHVVDGLTTQGTLLGTIAYMAPEVASGKKATIQSDIYALGLVFYQMVTGKIPFENSSTPFELIEKIKSEALIPPSELNHSVPKNLEILILKMCAKSPGDRYLSVDCVLDDLTHWNAATETIADSQLLLKHRDNTIEVPKEGAYIGTNANCLIIIDGDGIEDYHARITFDDDSKWFLQDMATTHGTRINGQLIQKTQLQNNDVITIERQKVQVFIPKNKEYHSPMPGRKGSSNDKIQTALPSRIGQPSNSSPLKAQSVRHLLVGAGLFALISTFGWQYLWIKNHTSGNDISRNGDGHVIVAANERENPTATPSISDTPPTKTPQPKERSGLISPDETKASNLEADRTVQGGLSPVNESRPVSGIKTSAPNIAKVPNISPVTVPPIVPIVDLPKELSLDLGGGVKMEMVLVPAGEFMMGADDGEDNERPVHKVKISQSFYIGKYDVTVSQFRAFADSTKYQTDAEKQNKGATVKNGQWQELSGTTWRNPGFKQENSHPACVITWNDAQEFVAWTGKLTGRDVRLPSEAQWEYAARGPESRRSLWGDKWEGNMANVADASLRREGFNIEWGTNIKEDDGYPFTSPGGAYKNASWCGAYDMAGNVWQWCQDYFNGGYYGETPLVDPHGPATGDRRVLRGGSWADDPAHCRSEHRNHNPPGYPCAVYGFRVVVVGVQSDLLTAKGLRPEVGLSPINESSPVSGLKTSEPNIAKVLNIASVTTTPKEDLPKELSLDLGGGVKMEMVLVPAGEFMMGAEDGNGDEKPIHKVKLSQQYYIGKYDVTLAQFRVFADSTKYQTGAEKVGSGSTMKDGEWQGGVPGINWRNPGFKQDYNHPVGVITWNDAQEFCKWASKLVGRKVRLPTEAEWEYAARGPESRSYPWGDKWEDTLANVADASLRRAGFNMQWGEIKEDDGYPFTSPGGAYNNASWCGAYDMAGNEQQWCEDYFSDKYYGESPTINPQGPVSGGEHLLRGGWWGNPPGNCRSAYRFHEAPGGRSADFGFRVVVAGVQRDLLSAIDRRNQNPPTVKATAPVLMEAERSIITLSPIVPEVNKWYGTWTKVGAMSIARCGHAAVRLQNGNALVIGGEMENGAATSTCEIYNQSKKTWQVTGTMARAREKHTATVLQNGMVLVVGGIEVTSHNLVHSLSVSGETLSSCELYDPKNGQWSGASALNTPRNGHQATLLNNGTVLITGGYKYNQELSHFRIVDLIERQEETDGFLDSCEIYNPETNKWSMAEKLSVPRAYHISTLLDNGNVFVFGGSSHAPDSEICPEIYDATTGRWRGIPGSNTNLRRRCATLMGDGRVLISGGVFDARGHACEIYDPNKNIIVSAADLLVDQNQHTAVLLKDGRVFVCGHNLDSSLYDPRLDSWRAGASVSIVRQLHTATLLTDGTVLVAGGFKQTPDNNFECVALSSCDLFDPVKPGN